MAHRATTKSKWLIALSGAYDFSDQESLALPGSFKDLVQNYCFADTPPAEPEYSATFLAASVVSRITSTASPMLLVQSETESMPSPQMPALVAALDAVGVTNYQTILVPGTAHSWPNWPVVKDQALTFIATVFAAGPTEIPPSITTQPKKKTVNPGSTARFQVVATSSTPMTYQWRKNGTNIVDATNASYTTPSTSSSDNGSLFSVVINNSAGSVTSSDALLTVRVPPTITKPPANRTAKVGATATFKVTASGTKPLSYQWRKNGADIAGATNASYTTPPVAAVDDGALFSVVVSNAAGSATSVGAKLTVP